MKFSDSIPFNSTVPVVVQDNPWDVIAEEADLSVGLVLVNVCAAAAAGSQRKAQLTNISAAGQNIRVGSAPQFAATAKGTLLTPGSSVTWIFGAVTGGINAIADAAAGTLGRLIWDS